MAFERGAGVLHIVLAREPLPVWRLCISLTHLLALATYTSFTISTVPLLVNEDDDCVVYKATIAAEQNRLAVVQY